MLWGNFIFSVRIHFQSNFSLGLKIENWKLKMKIGNFQPRKKPETCVFPWFLEKPQIISKHLDKGSASAFPYLDASLWFSVFSRNRRKNPRLCWTLTPLIITKFVKLNAINIQRLERQKRNSAKKQKQFGWEDINSKIWTRIYEIVKLIGQRLLSLLVFSQSLHLP